jgi:hypothetical protein
MGKKTMKIMKKLSSSKIMGSIAKVVKEMEVGATAKLYSIYGTANGIKTGVSQFGEWTQFNGDLGAVNYLTGEVMQAPSGHIPEPLCTMLKAKLADNDEVEFAIEVSVTRLEDDKETGAISYEYIVDAKQEIESSNRLAHLQSLVEVPKLAAPTAPTVAPTAKVSPKKAAKATA